MSIKEVKSLEQIDKTNLFQNFKNKERIIKPWSCGK